MASTTSPRVPTTTITECANCGTDKAVHVIDGCSTPEYQRVKVCKCCHERPDRCYND